MANKTVDIQVSSYTAQPRSERRRGAVSVVSTGGAAFSSTLAADVELLKSYWHLDDNGNLCTDFNAYTTGTFSALGHQADTGGSGSGGSAEVDLTGYATQAWVYSQDYATEAWVTALGYQTAAQVNSAIASHTHATRTLWGQSFNGSANVDGTIVVKATDGTIRSILWQHGGVEVRNADQDAFALQFSAGRCKVLGFDGERTAKAMPFELTGDFYIPAGKKIICGSAWLMFDTEADCWRSNKGFITDKDITAPNND